VYSAVQEIAQAIGAELDVVTVEPGRSDESIEPAPAVPSAGTLNLQQMLGDGAPTIRIRRGPVVPELLAEVEASRAQVLVIGYHRGGVPNHRRVGSIGRTLAGLAPCAVLTVPL
jgi:nucleotide-binding universal stress UspA family protein